MGSSRGARNVLASQLQDSLGLSCFNLSYPGSDIEFHEFLLRSLLKFNEKPKVLMLVIDPTELVQDTTINFRLDRLYPLAWYNHINNEMIARGEKNILSKFMLLSRINRKNFDIRKRHFSKNDTLLKCGSMPMSFQRVDKPFKYGTSLRPYSREGELEVKINAFRAFESYCTQNGIPLLLIFPPYYGSFKPSISDRISELKAPTTAIWIYDTSTVEFKDKSYFFDGAHLQKNGATIFTAQLANFIKKNYSHLLSNNR